MKEYTIDPNEMIYFKPRDVWCIPRHLVQLLPSLIMQNEVLINKEKYKVVGHALIDKGIGCSDIDILFKKVLED